MKEINPEKPDKQKKTEEKPSEPKPLTQQVKELKEFKDNVLSGEIKTKKIKIPRKAKVKKRKLKQGWLGILRVDENRNMTGEKQRVSGNSYKTKDGTYHAMEGDEMLWFEGKFPVVIQFSNKTKPVNLNIGKEMEQNETFADRYKMAKMLADTIKIKSKGGKNIIIWILIAGAALFGINYMMGGNMF